jgi:hypothetical protein
MHYQKGGLPEVGPDVKADGTVGGGCEKRDRSYACQCFTTASVESMMVPSISKRKPSNVTRSGGAVKDALVSVVEPIVPNTVMVLLICSGRCGVVERVVWTREMDETELRWQKSESDVIEVELRLWSRSVSN